MDIDVDLLKEGVLSQPFLGMPSKVSDDGQAFNKSLLKYYSSPDWKVVFFASIINSAVANNKPVFALSYNLMKDLIFNDVNIKGKTTITGKEFKILKVSLENVFIKTLYPSSNYGQGRFRAALYKFVHPEIRKQFKDIEATEKLIIEQYRKDNKV